MRSTRLLTRRGGGSSNFMDLPFHSPHSLHALHRSPSQNSFVGGKYGKRLCEYTLAAERLNLCQSGHIGDNEIEENVICFFI